MGLQDLVKNMAKFQKLIYYAQLLQKYPEATKIFILNENVVELRMTLDWQMLSSMGVKREDFEKFKAEVVKNGENAGSKE